VFARRDDEELRMPQRNLLWILGIGLVSIFCWAVAQGSLAPPRGPMQYVKGFPGNDLKDYDNLSLYLDVMQHVDSSYVTPLTDEQRRRGYEAAIQAYLHSLDEHSGYLNPKATKQFSLLNEGSFGGIGVQISVDRNTGKLTVLSPMPGTPAYRNGIKAGDVIEKINGEAVTNVDQAVERIQGKIGDKLTLTIRHRGADKAVDVELIREEIKVENFLSDQRGQNDQWDFMLDRASGIGYIRMKQFVRNSAEDLRKIIVGLKQQGMKALILDLRGNPGGMLDAAVEVADLFLDRGDIVTIEGRNKPIKTFKAGESRAAHQVPGPLLPREPIAVLIDDGSASASEIVAAALQDHKRGVVVGSRSFGKASVQSLIQLESGRSTLKLTTGRYMRPSGKNIHRSRDMKDEDDWGVRPDAGFEVKLSKQEEADYWAARAERDIVRDRSIPLDLDDRCHAVLQAFAGGLLVGQPHGLVAGLTQLAAAEPILIAKPRIFSDKALDLAVGEMKRRLGQ
jgi:carboxyl-terminal processing protease